MVRWRATGRKKAGGGFEHQMELQMDIKVIIAEALSILAEGRGMTLGGYKAALFEKGLRKRAAALGFDGGDGIDGYLAKLRSDPGESDRLIDILLIGVSAFYRDPLVFETLATRILPEIVQRKRRGQRAELRIWSAGCATGEEAYSVAMLAAECLKAAACLDTERRQWELHVFGTDVNEDALAAARSGRYAREALGNMKLHLFDRYVRPAEGRYELSRSIRKVVHFSEDDLLGEGRLAPSDSIFGEFDLVLCRNVLIYYELAHQRKILRRFHRVLNDGGFLVLGDSEVLAAGPGLRFTPVDYGNRIYRKEEKTDAFA